ncbi:arabinan endo-1,5-alpha-L-arabinosidase [Mucilaginibacter robiniae]|uniref:Arabinan endo-1,5-alpha-L-arabinosidase n=2 Tax=Mucilaginibacter robiniae TaxID=2728022 RepID=A0A7L5ECX4_9SPHI|nr:arabinan endo-1,5-alpha-L-arabinosidase [Mucilaginibacter robiniae]
MIKQDSVYHMYCTGWGIASWSSTDMVHWKAEKPVFAAAPQWAVEAVLGFKGHLWAPDISYYNGLYYLYYAVSTYGSNTSCIGVATNKTLDVASADYAWTDHGKLIQSVAGKNNWNAIVPNLITDKDGTPYLAFGSFWGGIKMVKLNPDRRSLAQSLDDLPTIASRIKSAPDVAGLNPIEAPFIFRSGKYYYLFASIDYCCKGPQSTYKIIVGRSKKLLGPYVDKEGVELTYGGGTILLQGDKNWYGVGHNAVCNFNGTDYLIFHGYDANDQGKSKLIIDKLTWSKGWPEAKDSSVN